MTNGTDSDGRKRGLFARIFGRGRDQEKAETAESQAPAPPPFEEPPGWPPPSLAAEEEDELVLGPAQMAAAPAPESAAAATPAEQDDDDEEALPLGPASAIGEAGTGADSGASGTPATEAEDTASPAPAPEEEDAILARLRAVGVGEGTVANTTAEEYVLPEEGEKGATPEPQTETAPETPDSEETAPQPGAFAPGWLDRAEEGRREAPAFDFDPERPRGTAGAEDTENADADPAARAGTPGQTASDPAAGETPGTDPVSLFPGGAERDPGAEGSVDWPPAEEPSAEELSSERPQADAPAGADTPANDRQPWHADAPDAPDTRAEAEDDLQALTAAFRAAEERDATAPSAWQAPEADPGTAEAPEGAEATGETPADETPAAAADPAFEAAVRRLVRAEMEGALGQRLSANIRRMIREEVADALSQRG